MGTELSSYYKICCGESENSETLNEVENEAKQNGETPADDFDFEEKEVEIERTSLLTKKSNAALDSFLKHQFHELTPQIIEAQGLDPINEIWTDDVRGLLFRAGIILGPLSNLSKLIYEDLDLSEINLTYTETLKLNTTLSLTIKIRESESLNLGLEAKIGIGSKGTSFDLQRTVKGTVSVIGVKVKGIINLDCSLDIEWIKRTKSIEGIFNNHLELETLEISYDKIVVQFVRVNAGDEITPALWTKIEEGITGAISDVFKKQITKLLNKIMKKELSKVLNQINEETPKFEIGFDTVQSSDDDDGNNNNHNNNNDDNNNNNNNNNGGNKLLAQLRKFKL